MTGGRVEAQARYADLCRKATCGRAGDRGFPSERKAGHGDGRLGRLYPRRPRGVDGGDSPTPAAGAPKSTERRVSPPGLICPGTGSAVLIAIVTPSRMVTVSGHESGPVADRANRAYG